MTIKTTHTPTPWQVVFKNDKYSKDELLIVRPSNKKGYEEVICGCIMNEEFAYQIVNSVNNHERMKEALIYARLALADEPEKYRAELDNIGAILKDLERG